MLHKMFIWKEWATLCENTKIHFSGQYLPYLTLAFSYFLGFSFPSVNSTCWPFLTPGLQVGDAAPYPSTEPSSPLRPTPKIVPISSHPNVIQRQGPHRLWSPFCPHFISESLSIFIDILFPSLSLGTLSGISHICPHVPGNHEKIE